MAGSKKDTCNDYHYDDGHHNHDDYHDDYCDDYHDCHHDNAMVMKRCPSWIGGGRQQERYLG